MSNKKITDVISNIFNSLGLSKDSYQIEFGEEERIDINIQVPEEEVGLFIGRHGEGVNSLRLLLSLIISQRTGNWPKLKLNINDYQEKRSQFLNDLVEDAAKKAIELQREIILPNLSSFERRIVHLHAESLENISTESRGEEPHRQLIIIPKN